MSEHGQPARAAAGEAGISGGTVNSGVIFNGGTISGGVIAGGQGSSITVSQAGAADDRMAQIERLIQQLQATASKLDGEQAEQVQDDAVRLAGEVKQRKPDRERITNLMNRISQAAVPFASLVDIAAQLKGLI
jgi:hypothetical protein